MLTTDNVIFSALIAAVIFYQISMIVKYFHRKQNKNHKNIITISILNNNFLNDNRFSDSEKAILLYAISKTKEKEEIVKIDKIKKDLETALNKLLDLDYAKTKNN